MDRNVKDCLSSKLVCVGHYALVGQRVSPVFQKYSLEKIIHTSTGKLYGIQAAAKKLQSQVVFYVSPFLFRLF